MRYLCKSSILHEAKLISNLYFHMGLLHVYLFPTTYRISILSEILYVVANLVRATAPLYSLPRTQQTFHPILLRRADECRGAVLLYDVKYLIPQQIGLLLERLSHLNKRACNRSSGGRMLADEPVLTHCLLALNEAGKCLCVAFNQARIHKTLTAALLQP